VFRPDTLFVNRSVSEPFPVMDAPATEHSAMLAAAAEPVPLTSGRFHTNAHETNGMATIYRLPDGRRVLRLTEFATSNGPDVRVYLVAADDVQGRGRGKERRVCRSGRLEGQCRRPELRRAGGPRSEQVPSGFHLVPVLQRELRGGAAPRRHLMKSPW